MYRVFITQALAIGALGLGHAAAFAQAAPPAPISLAASTWPIQVRAEVPFPPTPFPSEGSQHLFYELLLTNLSGSPVALHKVDVMDGDRPDARPLATLAGSGLADIIRLDGSDGDTASTLAIPAGGTLVVFLEVLTPKEGSAPARLVHRLSFGDGFVTTGAVPVSRRVLKALGRPVAGASWIAADGPGSDPDNHHRRGLFVIDGALTDSRRLAVDWKIMKDGKSYHGDKHAAASYFAYGKPLLAVGDALVVRSEDGHPDNPAGHGSDFHPAEPVTIANVGGNHVVLNLGDGQYAHYFHMKAGSVRVRPGEHVRKGQVIGMIGSSGDAREPHLHLEITNTPNTLTGDGIPYVIDHYTVMQSKTGGTGARTRQLPLDGMVIDFGK
jgi:hypothetical protein